MRARRRKQRGVTLIEMMVTVGLMSVVMGGIVMFLATHARMAAGSFDRTDIQRSGRGALTILEDEIGGAGTGLPKILAIKRFDLIDGTTANACTGSPRLEVASVDYLQQWKVTGTTGDTAAGTINLAALTDGPPPNPNPGGSTNDEAIPNNQWLFIYTTASQDLTGSFGANRGHGMVMTGATRAIGATSITISSTAYSGVQLTLDLANTSELNNTSGRGSVVMRADVSAFGLNCQDPDHPYLYWQDNGQSPTPLASNVATAGLGITSGVGLTFRFLLDLAPAGEPDGVGDTWATSLTLDPNPAVGNHDNVTAVEISLILRSDVPDPQLEDYRTETFTLLIQTPNIHTKVDPGDSAELGRFFFVENTGI